MNSNHHIEKEDKQCSPLGNYKTAFLQSKEFDTTILESANTSNGMIKIDYKNYLGNDNLENTQLMKTNNPKKKDLIQNHIINKERCESCIFLITLVINRKEEIHLTNYPLKRDYGVSTYDNVKAIGKACEATKMIKNLKQQKLIEKEPKAPIKICKRFVEKCEQIDKIHHKQNNGIKVFIESDPNIKNGLTIDMRAKIYNVKRMVYKSYLTDRYKTVINKKTITSEYSQTSNLMSRDSSQSKTADNVNLPKIINSQTSRLSLSHVKRVFECRDAEETIERFNNLIKKRIVYKSDVKSDFLNEMSKKCSTLCEHIDSVKKTRPTSFKYKTNMTTLILNETFKRNKELSKDHIHELIEGRINKRKKAKRVNRSVSNKIYSDKNTHIGSENFPELLQRRFTLYEPIRQEQRQCLEEIIFNKWNIKTHLKISKDNYKNEYNVITYGSACVLSNCCNSLVLVKISKQDGCKVLCLNKSCLIKTLECFLLRSDDISMLFSDPELIINDLNEVL